MNDIDEALRNAQEALALYPESLAQEGRELPAPYRLTALKDDPEIAAELRDRMLALIDLPAVAAHAAE